MKIKEIGDQYGIDKLTTFDESLLLHVNNFDIDRILSTLDMYPKLVTTIKQHSKSENRNGSE